MVAAEMHGATNKSPRSSGAGMLYMCNRIFGRIQVMLGVY